MRCYSGATMAESQEVRITIRIPSALHKRIVNAAEEDLRSLNSEIVWLLQRGMAIRKPPED